MEDSTNKKEIQRFDIKMKIFTTLFLAAISILVIKGVISWPLFAILAALNLIVTVGYAYTRYKKGDKWGLVWKISLYLLAFLVVFLLVKCFWIG